MHNDRSAPSPTPQKSRLFVSTHDGREWWTCCSCCETPGEPGVCYFNTTPNRHTGPCEVCDPDVSD